MKNKFFLMPCLCLALLVSACSDYKSRWQDVETGHSRKDVIRIMGGEPNESDAIVLPMGIKGERMIWKGTYGEIYKVDVAFDRVVFKSTDE